jgi:hypothetical protein
MKVIIRLLGNKRTHVTLASKYLLMLLQLSFWIFVEALHFYRMQHLAQAQRLNLKTVHHGLQKQDINDSNAEM